MEPVNFFSKLKQRKLVQWAIAYVAAAFALLQGIDIIASRFGWPDWIERAFIITSCIGFFVAVVLAWYHGERGTQRITGVELVILTLLLSLGGFVLWHFAGDSAKPETASAVGRPNDNKVPPAAIPEKSIAVLPFENLSDEKANAYFANGIQDEILTRLAKIGALKVISRTSTALETLAKEPIGPDLGDLRYSPSWDNLRGKPRFQKLIDKLEAAIGEQPRVAVR